MKKRVLSLLLVLLMVMSLVPMSALADKSSTVAYAVERGNIYFNKATGTITDCDESVTKAIIPAEIDGVAVTSIGVSAFRNCTSLASIVIPNSVTSIGSSAFSDCTSLASIAIPDSVTSIDFCAFQGCTSLVSIDIPNSVTSIGYYAFSGCTSLASINIPNSVTSINWCAFSGCTSLASIDIPNSVTSIGDYAFNHCTSLVSVDIPNSVTRIGDGAFLCCTSLVSIDIPNSVTRIGDRAFVGCTSLADVYYAGDAAQWNAIKIEPSNEPLTGATIHYGVEHTHSYTAAVTAPTCTEQGYTTYTCSCGDSYKSDYKDALGHDYKNGLCTRCGAKDPGATPPHTHDYKAVVTKPTCTQAGYTTYTCSCGDSYKSDYKDALGHDYKNGACTRCGAKDPSAHTHDYKAVVIKPTCTERGYTTYTCSVCGDSYKGSYVDPLGHDYKNGTCTRCGVKDPNYKPQANFTDVAAGSYCYDAVQWAVANGITNGTDTTHFSPNATCTRGQVVTFMYRAEGEPAVSGSNGFVDVAAGSYCYNAVQWAVANGITKGTDTTHFSPSATCTRGQVVTFLYRAQ